MRKFALVALLLAAVAGAVFWYWQQRMSSVMRAPGPHTAAVVLDVKPGMGARAALAELANLGAIADKQAVELEMRLKGWPSIKAGRYEIAARATPREIFEQLAAGRVVLESLTVIEGWRFADLRRAVERHPAIEVTLRGLSDAEVMEALGHAGEHPEGRFFPDTYRFAAGTTDRALLGLAYDKMAKLLAEAWADRADNLPIRTPYEALTLASIIEKETALPAERPQIAGVFVARLRKGMRLQTDPTVIYGLGERYDGNIRERDLRTDTPYNTYTRTGLTPTPIALPSREAVLAAVRPQETNALYFVATGLGDGSHYFSATYAEHNEALQRYLTRLRANRAASAGGSE
jgi:UPF0755 protein